MKTVIDAVNEFKGEWPYGVFNTIIFGKHKQGWSDFYTDNNTTLANDNWNTICFTDEFLAIVAECETNFGKCSDIAISHWKKCTKVLLTKDLDKELDMDIDWSKAPDGATHYNPSDFVDLCKYYKLSGDEYVYFYNGRWESSGASKKGLDKVLIKRPQPTPIFTKEMADNGVLPSVGMEVMIDGEKRAILMGADKDGDYITMSKGVYQFDSIGYIKPLNPPITLIDKGLYLVDIGNKKELVGEAYYTTIGEYWMINSLRTNASYRAELCTNIQPLTVEVK